MSDRPLTLSEPNLRALQQESEAAGRGKRQHRVPMDRHNVTVCGDIWGPKAPWAGLRFAEAVVRTHSLISGHPMPHLAVPFCHPADEPMVSEDCGVYRVRPRIEVGDRLWVRTHDKASRARSRFTLIVTEVRVQRLQDISGDDVVAEGLWLADQRQLGRAHEAIAVFAKHWNSVHGPDSWDQNPWVAVLTWTVIPTLSAPARPDASHPPVRGADGEAAPIPARRTNPAAAPRDGRDAVPALSPES